MKKNFITSIITIALVFCLLAACDEDEKNKDEEPPTVTSVTVSPATANVNTSQTRHFDVHVTGTNNPPQTVTWAVTGNSASGTTISPTGLLSVAASETANATLTVTATSTLDATKSGTATVSVKNIVVPTGGQILSPASTSTQLTGNGLTVSTNHSGGNKWLIQPTQPPQSRAYGYETWDESGSPGSASFTWYGRNQGGGLAFKATWTNVKDFLARTGYNWDENKAHSDYGNIYCGFNFSKSGTYPTNPSGKGIYGGNFSYIGIYGWSRNPGASVASERLVEYYIVEDSYGNQYRDATGFMTNIGTETLNVSEVTPSYTMDSGTYKVFKKTRTGDSIEGNKTFTQFFSVRQAPRQSGTISVSEHFREWEKRGMNLGNNIYECKFKVEAGGNETGNPLPGTGTFDARLIQFYRADDNGTILEITQ